MAKNNIQSKLQSVKPTSRRPMGPGKTFHKDGHWIENPHKAPVLICACGNRYLKTRDRQGKCLRCLSQGK